MIDIILEWISSVLFLGLGFLSITRYMIKIKIKIYYNLVCVIANGMWVVYSYINDSMMYFFVGVLYVILSLLGVFNFILIYKKAKKGKEYKLI